LRQICLLSSSENARRTVCQKCAPSLSGRVMVSLDALPPQGTRDVYARRSSLGHQGWDEHQLAVPRDLPLPGNTGRGVTSPCPGLQRFNAPRELLRATQRVLGAVHVPESVAHG
jgi:hypothetical protein